MQSYAFKATKRQLCNARQASSTRSLSASETPAPYRCACRQSGALRGSFDRVFAAARPPSLDGTHCGHSNACFTQVGHREERCKQAATHDYRWRAASGGVAQRRDRLRGRKSFCGVRRLTSIGRHVTARGSKVWLCASVLVGKNGRQARYYPRCNQHFMTLSCCRSLDILLQG